MLLTRESSITYINLTCLINVATSLTRIRESMLGSMRSFASLSNCLGLSRGGINVSLPVGLVPNHRVQGREELAHTGSEGDFLGLAGRQQAGIEGFDHGVPACGRHRGHVQCGPHRGTPTPDGPLPTQGAAVVVQGRHA